MWLILQQDEPDDYVIATGKTHSVREFLDEAFGYLDLDPRDCVKFDSRYLRPTEVDVLLGDASKARERLGWESNLTMQELCRLMVDADMELAQRERTLVEAGYAP